MANFLCIAQFISQPGKEEELYQALLTLLEPTRAEPGCISYNLHQNVENSSIFTMTECFESKEAFDFHSTQPYLQHFRERAKNAIESVTLTLGTKL
ncbi:putative quinol monooxygenase [Legionella rowbothamii]|uniref:putative quinol monooxygenase n=1 Tax=Legionella rowbothamii TaxID=96229 RepID=UPI001055D6FF|nr:putative quinol monooxygenase [Legionella rowbothamii]